RADVIAIPRLYATLTGPTSSTVTGGAPRCRPDHILPRAVWPRPSAANRLTIRVSVTPAGSSDAGVAVSGDVSWELTTASPRLTGSEDASAESLVEDALLIAGDSADTMRGRPGTVGTWRPAPMNEWRSACSRATRRMDSPATLARTRFDPPWCK